MQISGRRVLVTGAAGGLGSAITRQLANRGAVPIVSGRNVAALEALAADVGGEVVIADLSRRSDLDQLIEVALGCDVLVANAGIGGDRSLPEATVEHIDDVIDVNLRAPIVLATTFAQHKVAAGEPGHIVMIGSLAGLVATPGSRMYNATKFGLRGFALSLRQDLDDTTVGVSIVEPGFIRDAGMFADGDIELPAVVRTKSPADVADAVIEAIETDRGEIFVSPIELRLSATFGTIAPAISAAVQRKLGAKQISART